MSDVTGT